MTKTARLVATRLLASRRLLLVVVIVSLATVLGCTVTEEYTGEVDCPDQNQDLDALLLLERSFGSSEPEGWFGWGVSRDTYFAAPLDNAELNGSDLEFSLDFGTTDVDVNLTATADGWEGEMDQGTAADCDVLLELER